MSPGGEVAGLIPAAGLSARMGRPKLILPVDGALLIARVVRALRDGGADRVVVVVGPAGTPGSPEVLEAAQGLGAETVVAPAQPPDMRASVELGLGHLSEGLQPSTLLLTPGDSPGLSPSLVARVIRKGTESPGRIVVPRHEGRRGHPVLIPWELASRIPSLPPGVGVNALLAENPDRITWLDLDDPGILADLDTPDDYRRWSGRGGTFNPG